MKTKYENGQPAKGCWRSRGGETVPVGNGKYLQTLEAPPPATPERKEIEL